MEVKERSGRLKIRTVKGKQKRGYLKIALCKGNAGREFGYRSGIVEEGDV